MSASLRVATGTDAHLPLSGIDFKHRLSNRAKDTTANKSAPQRQRPPVNRSTSSASHTLILVSVFSLAGQTAGVLTQTVRQVLSSSSQLLGTTKLSVTSHIPSSSSVRSHFRSVYFQCKPILQQASVLNHIRQSAGKPLDSATAGVKADASGPGSSGGSGIFGGGDGNHSGGSGPGGSGPEGNDESASGGSRGRMQPVTVAFALFVLGELEQSILQMLAFEMHGHLRCIWCMAFVLHLVHSICDAFAAKPAHGSAAAWQQQAWSCEAQARQQVKWPEAKMHFYGCESPKA